MFLGEQSCRKIRVILGETRGVSSQLMVQKYIGRPGSLVSVLAGSLCKTAVICCPFQQGENWKLSIWVPEIPSQIVGKATMFLRSARKATCVTKSYNEQPPPIEAIIANIVNIVQRLRMPKDA